MVRHLLAAVLIVSLPSAPALAGKPDHAGKHAKQDRDGRAAEEDGGFDVSVVFSAPQRDAIRGYHVERYGHGHCPPGLAKKNNGCLPPGQAKKRYAVRRPLPPEVVILDLPGDLAVRIGTPPQGYRYGLIDGDVVKLALGTLLVVDAIGGLTD
jgi:hypothetical protein